MDHVTPPHVEVSFFLLCMEAVIKWQTAHTLWVERYLITWMLLNYNSHQPQQVRPMVNYSSETSGEPKVLHTRLSPHSSVALLHTVPECFCLVGMHP